MTKWNSIRAISTKFRYTMLIKACPLYIAQTLKRHKWEFRRAVSTKYYCIILIKDYPLSYTQVFKS